MNPNTPEEPEKDGRDTAPRKRSMEIKPETKPTLPYYPLVILAAAGAAVGTILAIDYCTQRVEPMHTPGMYVEPSLRDLLENAGKHEESSESALESQGKSLKEAPVRQQDGESGKAGSAE